MIRHRSRLVVLRASPPPVFASGLSRCRETVVLVWGGGAAGSALDRLSVGGGAVGATGDAGVLLETDRGRPRQIRCAMPATTTSAAPARGMPARPRQIRCAMPATTPVTAHSAPTTRRGESSSTTHTTTISTRLRFVVSIAWGGSIRLACPARMPRTRSGTAAWRELARLESTAWGNGIEGAM